MAGWLLGVFGILGLLLALVGLYGVVAFSAAHRTREIGVRMALGAARGEIVRMVLRQGVSLTCIGLGIGVALAWIAGRLIAGQLLGVSGTDPLTIAGTAGLLLLVAICACSLPALRAAALDPLKALRRD
jgi:ABC-type antimicrobial peptide transport system permease subunit